MKHEFSTSSLQLQQTTGLEYRYQLDNPSHAPLAFLLHGRAGNYKLMSTFARLVPEHWNVILPQAPVSDPVGGYSWWLVDGEHAEVTQQALTASETFSDYALRAISAHQLNPQYIVGIGFSQGGALLSIVAQQSILGLKALALLASFAVDAKVESDLSALSVLSLHGSKDQVVDLNRLEESLEVLTNRGAQVTRLIEPVAHKVGSQGMHKLKDWLNNL